MPRLVSRNNWQLCKFNETQSPFIRDGGKAKKEKKEGEKIAKKGGKERERKTGPKGEKDRERERERERENRGERREKMGTNGVGAIRKERGVVVRATVLTTVQARNPNGNERLRLGVVSGNVFRPEK